MARGKIDYSLIADRALGSIESLLREWLPDGKQQGNEYKARNPTRADDRPGSFSINLSTGTWADFATGDKGGDLISLYAYLNHLSQADAARELAHQLGMAPPEKTVDTKPAKAPRSEWRPIHPVPHDAGEPPAAHLIRGKFERRWAYLAADGQLNGYVCLFRTSDGGKETLPLSYCEHVKTGEREWKWLAFAEPRPLYGLDRLAARPELPVLLVEGEKCADVAINMLPELVIVSWPGGSKAVDKVDLSPLAGRNIFAWADADAKREPLSKTEKAEGVDPDSKPFLPEYKQPGVKAMRRIARILSEYPDTKCRLVKIPQPGEKPDGWDIADAVTDGMDSDALKAFIRNVATVETIEDEEESGDDAGWKRSLLKKNHELVPCLANVFRILCNDPEWKGVLAYNSFSYQIEKLKPPPYEGGKVGEWDDHDDAKTAIWLTEKYRFAPTATLAADAVETVARHFGYNPVQDYLRSLTWDGVERLDSWLTDYMGAPKTEYVWRVARWFIMGMVARAMSPGIKFDYCLVLVGPQGYKKSTALRVLGGAWFGDTDLDFHNKDSMSAIRGKWLWEFAELDAIMRSEASRQKSFLSRQVDEFRPPYGRREIRSPRQLVFAGTTNEWEWVKDSTGARRFWPIECAQEIDHVGLAAARDQLFAEAMVRYLAGERFWPTTEEQADIFDEVQMRHQAPDTMAEMMRPWVTERSRLFQMSEAALDCLKLDASKLNKSMETRIGIALRDLGCKKVSRPGPFKAKDGKPQFWYVPPKRRWTVISEKDFPSEPEPDPDSERKPIPF